MADEDKKPTRRSAHRPSPRRRSFPSWAPIAGFCMLALTVVFLMVLVGVDLSGHPIDCEGGARGLVVFIIALVVGSAFAFLGGSASAEGKIPLFKDSPVKVATTGAIAAILVVTFLGFRVYVEPCTAPAGTVVNTTGSSEPAVNSVLPFTTKSQCRYLLVDPLETSFPDYESAQLRFDDTDRYYNNLQLISASVLQLKNYDPGSYRIELTMHEAAKQLLGGEGSKYPRRWAGEASIGDGMFYKLLIAGQDGATNNPHDFLGVAPSTEAEARRWLDKHFLTSHVLTPVCEKAFSGVSWQH